MVLRPTARFRLLLKHSLLEFYLDDLLIECFSLPEPATGRIGVVGFTRDMNAVRGCESLVLKMSSM